MKERGEQLGELVGELMRFAVGAVGSYTPDEDQRFFDGHLAKLRALLGPRESDLRFVGLCSSCRNWQKVAAPKPNPLAQERERTRNVELRVPLRCSCGRVFDDVRIGWTEQVVR